MKEVSLDGLKEAFVAAGDAGLEQGPVNSTAMKARVDASGRSYATGRRKEAVAKVWLKPGTGGIVVNGKDFSEYFKVPRFCDLVGLPFKIVGREAGYAVNATVLGGGVSAQAAALKHGISLALTGLEPDLRPILRSALLLTRDSRKVERKKFGHKKARRSFQFSKR